MNAKTNDLRKRWWLAFATLGITCVLSGSRPVQAAEQTREAREAEQCQRNLEGIRAALSAYRRDHKDIPRYLSDLIPRYVSDLSFLKCPACVRLGTTSDEIMKSTEKPDPRITYTYEFRDAPIPPGIAGGSERTMREWKKLQMTVIGSAVPMVRCHGHSRTINLSFGGNVFEGPPDFEDGFLDVAEVEDLTFSKLFAQHTVFRVVRIPERRPETPAHLIDLSDQYNASLQKGWHSDNPRNNLARLPSGVVDLHGIQFDVRGIIQLTAKKRFALAHYPRAVSNIVVGWRSATFHFLHATAFSVNQGIKIGSYVFHYADGQTAEFPILYGRHVLDWWSDPSKPGRFDHAQDSQVAWAGTNADRQAEGKGVYLYLSTWRNPRPTVEIKTMDFLSAMDESAPFLIAVTAEPAAK